MKTPTQSQVFLNQLSQAIVTLSRANQVAFGASCCERAFPHYVLFSDSQGWGDPAVLRSALDRVWAYVGGDQLSSEEAGKLEARCVTVTPKSEDFSNEYVDAAQEAAFMVTLLLRWCYDSNPSYAVRIATFRRDMNDLFVQLKENLDPNDSELEKKIDQHPLMLREIAYQREDLASLMETPSQGMMHAFEARARSRGRRLL